MIAEELQTVSMTLIATSGAGPHCQKSLKPDQGLFVGVSPDCGLQLTGDDLLHIHCYISLESGKLWLQDWTSGTGTRVNGQPITNKVELQPADVIQIGDYEITHQEASPPITRATPLVPNIAEPARCGDAETEPDTAGYEATPSLDDDRRSDMTGESCLLSASEDPSSAFGTFAVDAADFDDPCFGLEPDTFDGETVALLQAEIEELRSELAQRDSLLAESPPCSSIASDAGADDESDEVLERMKQLVDEANQSDERVAILEEMLHAAESASQSEQEERTHIEQWLGEIELRVGHREDEHRAEMNALRKRIEESNARQQSLQQRLQHVAMNGSAPEQYEETLISVQRENQSLQTKLEASEKERLAYKQRLEQSSADSELALREERANIARERAQVSRLRFELSSKLAAIEESPKVENESDKEMAFRIRTLREHLREIHEQEKANVKEESLATRLGKLWKRIDY